MTKTDSDAIAANLSSAIFLVLLIGAPIALFKLISPYLPIPGTPNQFAVDLNKCESKGGIHSVVLTPDKSTANITCGNGVFIQSVLENHQPVSPKIMSKLE